MPMKRKTKAQRKAVSEYTTAYDKEHYKRVTVSLPKDYYEPMLRVIAANPHNTGVSDYVRELVANDEESDW